MNSAVAVIKPAVITSRRNTGNREDICWNVQGDDDGFEKDEGRGKLDIYSSGVQQIFFFLVFIDIRK